MVHITKILNFGPFFGYHNFQIQIDTWETTVHPDIKRENRKDTNKGTIALLIILTLFVQNKERLHLEVIWFFYQR